MYSGHSIAVVMPAFNVEAHIAEAILTLPHFVDLVVVVDDASTDATREIIARCQRPGLILRRHTVNRGVGAAIATGYAEALRQGCQLIAVMAGDGQMDPADLGRVLEPVARGEADYCKGNRFRHPDIWKQMPRARLLGNICLSMMTKLTSGYWHLFDSQCGYTAISRQALLAIDGGRTLFARYGYPNDLLARLRSVGARVAEVPVRPVYEGQASGIHIWTVVYPICFVLLRSMGRRWWRMTTGEQGRPSALPTRRPDALSLEPSAAVQFGPRPANRKRPAEAGDLGETVVSAAPPA